MKTQTDGVNLIQGAFNYQQGFKSHQGDFLSHKLTTKAQNIPESIFLVSERLLRKHHDGTGVDRQGQSVVEVHVLQPVVINLNNNNNNNMGGGLLWGVASLSRTQVITLGFDTCEQPSRERGKKWRKTITVHHCQMKRGVGESGHGESGSLIDFTRLDEPPRTERSPRRGSRGWSSGGWTSAQRINLSCHRDVFLFVVLIV